MEQFNITQHDRIQLDHMLKEHKVEDTTHQIRRLKHSSKIKECIDLIETMKQTYPRMYKSNFTQFETMVQSRGGNWLWNHYTNIYNKLIKGQLDAGILYSMVNTLRKIETDQIDQHEGSIMIGKLLKRIYIDGATQADEKRKRNERKNEKKVKKISWKEYKSRFLVN